MQLVTITYDEVKKLILLSFAENLEAYFVYFDDIHYLIDNCQSYIENKVTITEETFQKYLKNEHGKRTIPVLLTHKFAGNLERIEYAFDFVLQGLQKRLDEIRKRVEKEYPAHRADDIGYLEKKAKEIIESTYKFSLKRKRDLDRRKYEKDHPEGGFYEDCNGGM